ncbi:MAG: archaellin/type IV pilin N-terminal domain-containing protein [Candidatus Woesearchaeota archaeon]
MKYMLKKGDVGIGTLIVFIAMILVAAIAAGVILRTAGVLQQRAFAVGAEARQRILSAIEVSNVVAKVNQTAHNTNKFEIMVRLMAGSYPVDFATTGYTFFTRNSFISAKPQHITLESFYDNPSFNISDLSVDDQNWKQVGDIDQDGVPEEVRLSNDTNGNLLLLLKLTAQRRTISVDLTSYNFTNGNQIEIEDLALYDTLSEDIWGFLQIKGTVTEDNTFKGLDARISEFPRSAEHQKCTFENLIPERYYCIDIKLGKNQDIILESGELFVIRYKLKESQPIGPDEEFGFKFIPKRGQETELYLSTPDVLVEATTLLYPR